VTKVTFVNTWHKIKYHFDVCWVTNGAHIETYKVTKKKFCATNLWGNFL
jgi:hypothetical protein